MGRRAHVKRAKTLRKRRDFLSWSGAVWLSRINWSPYPDMSTAKKRGYKALSNAVRAAYRGKR